MSTNDPKQENTEEQLPTRRWTVLAYLAGDNNLSEECVYSLTQVKEALSDDSRKLAVVAQFDPSGVRAETRRYLLRSKRFSLKQDADITGWRARETDTGEPQNLLEFIRWGIAQYPARYYLVILVGHGSGTEDDFLLRDENPPDSLSIPELQDVFQKLKDDGRIIHVLGMDTCLMNMAEVCFELLRTSVNYLVGSEGFSPNTGWPYAEILTELIKQIGLDENQPDEKKKVATPEWLAKRIVEEYKKFYEPYINGGISVDQSALEVTEIDGVKEKMFSLVRVLLDEISKGELNYGEPKQNALLLAHWESQSYNGEMFVDLYDFCERLAARYCKIEPQGRVVSLCKEVREAIDKLVVKTCIAGAAFQYSHGISIYFPWAILSPKYENLAWPKETKWFDFLKAYHEKTRRPGRPGGDVGKDTRDIEEPGRASVPTNKGRDGRVESMRNPPIKEFIGCTARPHDSVRECPPVFEPPPAPKGQQSTVATKATDKSQTEAKTKRPKAK